MKKSPTSGMSITSFLDLTGSLFVSVSPPDSRIQIRLNSNLSMGQDGVTLDHSLIQVRQNICWHGSGLPKFWLRSFNKQMGQVSLPPSSPELLLSPAAASLIWLAWLPLVPGSPSHNLNKF